MSGSCSHDALDWFAAIGPTLAAAAAAWATWKTAQVAKQVGDDAQALQRKATRPLLVLAHRHRTISQAPKGIRWELRVKNIGQSAANIDSFRVLVGGKEVPYVPMEPASQFWARAMQLLQPTGIGDLKCNVIRTPFAVAVGDVRLLFSVVLQGDPKILGSAIRALEVELKFSAPWGEVFELKQGLLV